MDEQSIFLQALHQPAGELRAAWLEEVCGIASPLRERIDALLRRHEQASSFLERPAAEFGETIFPDASGDNLAASLQAGLAPAFGKDKAVVLGSVGHSVLKVLRHTMDIPHVVLREPTVEGADRIERPHSPEIPKPASDSRYQLQGEIARGGMGAIIKGRDTDLGRELAIKVLLDQHKDKPEVVQRFIEEAQISGQLQHPGIAPVYELGQFTDNRPFFSMKLVKGETLAKMLAERHNATEDRGRFIGIFEHVCQTMAYAHARGVIHRDLKPANIMVGAFGEVQVMDWGLAKVLSAGGIADEKKAHDQHQAPSVIQTQRSKVGSDAPGTLGTIGSQTRMGSVMGTPAYMPPEQALGDIDNLDERADVFGLGAILCEILTGKPPYVADDGGLLFRMASRGKLADCFVRLDACGAEATLIALTKQCLELEPADRPRDASVLAAGVSRYLESVEAKLRKTEMAQVAAQAYAEESVRRHKLIHIAGAAVTIALAIGVAASGWQTVRANREATRAEAESRLAREAEQSANELATAEAAARSLAQQETRRAEAAIERAKEQLTRSEWLAYAGKIMLAQADFETGSGELTQHYLDECQPNLRGWEHRYLSTRINAKQTLVGHTGAVTSVAFSCDDKLIVTGSNDHSAKVWDSETGQQLLTLLGHMDSVTCVAFSPDGQRIVTGSEDKTVKVWDAQTGRELLTITEHHDCVKTLAFSPDGQRIAVGGGVPYQPTNVTVWDAQTGRELLLLVKHTDRVLSLAFSPDGKRIVTGCGTRAQVWDTANGQEVLSVEHGSTLGPVWCVAFSPDGQRIVTGGEDGKVKLWNAGTGQVLHVLKGHAGWVASLAFSPDGRRLATGSWDNTVKLWNAESGEEVLTLKGHVGWVLGVAFSTDGRRIVSGSVDKTATIWDAERGQTVVAVKHGPVGAIQSVAFSPDSTRIACGGEFGLAKVSDAKTGQELLALKGHTEHVHSVGFSPDGRRIVTGSNDKTVRIWDGPTGLQLRVLKGYTYPVAFSPDGRTIVAGHENTTLRVLDAETGQELLTLNGHAHQASSVAFSPDGQRIVTGGDDNTAKVWDAQTGREHLVLQGHVGSVTGVALSPDGQRVVTSSADKTARVWDAANGRQLLVLNGHTSGVRAVAFSPDGQRVVTASDDRSVKLWEVDKGLEVLSLNGHIVEVLCVAFSPDGQSVASGTANPDNTARVWHAETAPTNSAWPLPDAAERMRFHTEQADLAEGEHRTFVAEVHRRQVTLAETELVKAKRIQSLLLSEAQPENETERRALAALLSKRASAYVASEQWELALADFERLVELSPDHIESAFDSFRMAERWNEAAQFGHRLLAQNPAESLRWILVAPVIALSCDEADYIAFCNWIVDQPAETALLADRSIKACLLKPEVVELATLPSAPLARELDEGTAPDWFLPYGWATRALLAYRKGDFELAVKYVNQSEAHHPSDLIRVMNQSILAMAQHEQKHSDAAGSALEEASQLITGLREIPGVKIQPDLLIAAILLREAEVKIKGKDVPSRKADQ
ncbi:MAG: WD40 domain-containing protein [Pirellulaceae bacterium]